MKFNNRICFAFLLLNLPIFAQHEHHQTPVPQKQTTVTQKEINTQTTKQQTITYSPKVVRYDLYVRDTIVTFGNKPKRAYFNFYGRRYGRNLCT